jgi:uncharacterized membrane protein YccF (DUF307 family)
MECFKGLTTAQRRLVASHGYCYQVGPLSRILWLIVIGWWVAIPQFCLKLNQCGWILVIGFRQTDGFEWLLVLLHMKLYKRSGMHWS